MAKHKSILIVRQTHDPWKVFIVGMNPAREKWHDDGVPLDDTGTFDTTGTFDNTGALDNTVAITARRVTGHVLGLLQEWLGYPELAGTRLVIVTKGAVPAIARVEFTGVGVGDGGGVPTR